MENKQILKVLKYAKECVEEGKHAGLCSNLAIAFGVILNIEIPKDRGGAEVADYIPEFKPETFEGVDINPSIFLYQRFWWPITDKESRILAMDKLIEIYKQKVKYEK